MKSWFHHYDIEMYSTHNEEKFIRAIIKPLLNY